MGWLITARLYRRRGYGQRWLLMEREAGVGKLKSSAPISTFSGLVMGLRGRKLWNTVVGRVGSMILLCFSTVEAAMAGGVSTERFLLIQWLSSESLHLVSTLSPQLPRQATKTSLPWRREGSIQIIATLSCLTFSVTSLGN